MAETDGVADTADEPSDAPRAGARPPVATLVAEPDTLILTLPLPPVEAIQPAEREWGDADGPRLTFRQQALRAAVVALTLLVALALLAPIGVALLAMMWALVTDAVAALSIARLLRQGLLLETEPALSALSMATRVGFVAIGYLGYFFALMALLAGLLGRGRGRLFIIPGALLTGSALILLFTSVALAWPLIASLGASHLALLALALYALLDAVALATALADTRYTRYTQRQWRRARHAARSRLPGGPGRPVAMS